jgi:hypothetical protein
VATNAEILSTLADNLAQPRRARTDAGEVEQHGLLDQIAAAKFAIAMNGVSSSPFRALRFAQTISPNASGVADPTAISDVYPPPGMAGTPGYPAG